MTCNPAWFLVLVGWVQPTRSQRHLVHPPKMREFLFQLAVMEVGDVVPLAIPEAQVSELIYA